MELKKIKREVCRFLRQFFSITKKSEVLILKLCGRRCILKKTELKTELISKQAISDMEKVIFGLQCSSSSVEREINFLEYNYINLKEESNPVAAECEKVILVLKKYRLEQCNE